MGMSVVGSCGGVGMWSVSCDGVGRLWLGSVEKRRLAWTAGAGGPHGPGGAEDYPSCW